MGESQGTLGYGTLLQRDTYPATATYTSIAEVLDIKGPERSRDFEDLTHQESPSGYEEMLPKLKKGGTVTFPCNMLPGDGTQDDTTGLGYDFENGILRAYRIARTNRAGATSYRYFDAYVAKMGEAYPVQGKKVIDVTLQISAAVADTP